MAIPKEHKRLHSALGYALRALPEQQRPPPEGFHLQGPAPEVGLAGLVEVVSFCAEVARPLVPAGGRQAFDERLETARSPLPVYRQPEIRTPADSARARRGYAAHQQALQSWRERLGTIAQLDVSGLESLPVLLVKVRGGSSNPTNLHQWTGKATSLVVAQLLERQGASAASEFLQRLDRLLMRLEAAEQLAQRGHDGLAVERVLWRQQAGKGKGRHLLLQLESGRLGLLTKVGRRWTLFQGQRDDVLANLPEPLFASATAAYFAQTDQGSMPD